MLRHHLKLALRNARRAPLATAMNLATLAIGFACFLTTYAFVAYWDRSDAQFPDADRIYVLTQSFAMKNGTFARNNLTGTPLSAAAALAAEFPDATVARAGPLGAELSVASGGRAIRVVAVAADREFLELFPLAFAAGDART